MVNPYDTHSQGGTLWWPVCVVLCFLNVQTTGEKKNMAVDWDFSVSMSHDEGSHAQLLPAASKRAFRWIYMRIYNVVEIYPARYFRWMQAVFELMQAI